MSTVVQLHSKDDVVISLHEVHQGENLQIQTEENGIINIPIQEDIPKGHKILVRPVNKGEDVLKFGYSIGKAKRDISVGEWVHTHNLETGLKGILDYTYQPISQQEVNKESEHKF